uniref:Uncharacterized protein n=1 Tax=Plectus sambesii TaxID=2011161 RepID=A0A914UZ09_9BILA
MASYGFVLLSLVISFVASCPPVKPPCICGPSEHGPVQIVCNRAKSMKEVTDALANATGAVIDRLVITNTPIRTLERRDLEPLTSLMLQRLALVNNGIENVASDAFAPVKSNLLALDLSDNGLTKIDASLVTGAEQLISFAAQGNRIAVIEDGAFANMKSLCYIDLSFNRLSTLPENLLSGSFKRAPGSAVPRMLYVCENSWKCDAKLEWFREYLRNNADIIVDKPGCLSLCDFGTYRLPIRDRDLTHN